MGPATKLGRLIKRDMGVNKADKGSGTEGLKLSDAGGFAGCHIENWHRATLQRVNTVANTLSSEYCEGLKSSTDKSKIREWNLNFAP